MTTLATGTESPAARPSAAHQHVAYLDGVRALAALWVLLSHACFVTLGTTPGSGGLPGLLVHFGRFAVDVFIVLSGYCLMLPVIRKGELAGGTLDFYRRRARRILPPYFAAIVLAAALGLTDHMIGGAALHSPMKVLVVHLLLLQDWLPSLNAIDGPTWSVAVEWKIYFLFPVLVWVWRRWGAGAALAVAAAVAAAITLAAHAAHVFDHWGCPWYVLLFGMGMAACSARNSTRATPFLWTTFLACVAGCFISPVLKGIGGEWWLIALEVCTGAAAAAALALLNRQKEGRGLLPLLAWRPLVSIGSFSYSLYLMHFPLLVAIWAVARHVPYLTGHRHGAEAFILLAEAPACIVLAYVFFLAFERPFLTTRKRETPAEVARDAALSPAP